jgi:hypothetical protein
VAFRAEGVQVEKTGNGEVALPPQLEAHLAAAGEDGIPVETVQALATRQLSAEEAADTSLDVVSGFHLTDGVLRVVGVEGLKAGAMSRLIKDVRSLHGSIAEC